MTAGRVRVQLFSTCLADLVKPEVAEATVKLLEHAGVRVEFPEDQTCCGQPAFNAGYWPEASRVARHFLDIFDDTEGVIVCPSGSCASMVRTHYLHLFYDDPVYLERAQRVGSRVQELTSFLVRTMNVQSVPGACHARVTYHDSCHLLRDLRISLEPRRLLQLLEGVELVEMDKCEQCCGFGGAFSVKYVEVSTALLDEKLQKANASGAEILTACDAGCLMHMEGRVRRLGLPLKVVHVAELLANDSAMQSLPKGKTDASQ